MAIFAPGTGTLKSTYYEAALLEAAQIIEFAEESFTTPDTVNFTDVSFDNGRKTVDITINLPVTFTISSTDGSVRIAGDAYVTPTFVNGGGGSFRRQGVDSLVNSFRMGKSDILQMLAVHQSQGLV